MEKEQEVERERDRARSTKFFDPKFNFSEPPPKVGIPSAETLLRCVCACFDTSLQYVYCSLQEWNRGALGTRSVSGCTFRYSSEAGVTSEYVSSKTAGFTFHIPFYLCVYVQLNEALCASSPDLASPCEYQSPVDSMNTLTLPVRSPRRRSMGVRNTPLCVTC